MFRDHRITKTACPTTNPAEELLMDEIFADDLMDAINQNFVLEVEVSHFSPMRTEK